MFVATDPSVEGVTGCYWAKSRRTDDRLSNAARDDALAARLWSACERLTAET